MHDRDDHHLRIALVTPRPTTATEPHRSVQRLAAGLVAAGHRVVVLTDPPDDGCPEEEMVDGVLLRRFLPLLDGRRSPLSPGLARHLARSAGVYDLVHVHGDHGARAAAVARWWDGPLALTPGPDPADEAGGPARRRPCEVIERRAVARASVVVCASAVERQAFLERFPEAATRTTVVSPGVDLARLHAAPVVPGDHRRLVVVAGHLARSRHVDQAITAMTVLRPLHRLEVCGEGPERAALERQVDRLGLRSSVTFRGDLDEAELASALRSARCVVDLSEGGATDAGLLEAAAVGTPVVASTTPLHQEARDTLGEVVSLVPTRSDSDLAEAIHRSTSTGAAPVHLPDRGDVGRRVADLYRDVVRRRV